jgi:DNA polymerase III delta prime subunit
MLIGHKKIFEDLKEQVNAERLHHAQLFIGPKFVGKTKLALELAVKMQSGAVDGRQILDGTCADTLIFLDEGEVLPIKTVREIIERTGQTHTRPYLIVIIENIGRMKAESLNALLKTLEEPPPGCVFFLTANKDEGILPTIRSRCHVTYFHTVSDKILRGACEGNVFEEQLVMFAMGRPGKLRRLINDSEYFKEHQEMYSEVNQFLEKPDTHRAFVMARRWEKHGLLQEMLDILLQRIRTFALAGQQPLALEHLDFSDIMDNIEIVKQDLERNVNKKLLLENLLLEFAP